MRAMLFAALCAGAAAAYAVPAAAQDIEEVTIIARMPSGQPAEISEVVSVADLDLATRAGEEAMNARVRKVAMRLCAKLGETGKGPPLSASTRNCADDAVMRSRSQMETAVAAPRPGAVAVAEAPSAPLPDAAPVPPPAPSAPAAGEPASATVTTTTVTNGPVPDTPENRARFGQPMSRAGKATAARGN